MLIETTHTGTNKISYKPVILEVALLPCSEHHDLPLMGDLSIYEDDQRHGPFDNKHCTHHIQGKLHNANLGLFLCQDDKYYML